MNIEIYPSAEFHDRRRKGVGGSDVGKIMGVSAFGSALDVYCEKLGLVDQKPDNFPMRMGRKMEPIIRGEYMTQNASENSPLMEFCNSEMEEQMIVTKGDYYYYHPDGLLTSELDGARYPLISILNAEKKNSGSKILDDCVDFPVGDSPSDRPGLWGHGSRAGRLQLEIPGRR